MNVIPSSEIHHCSTPKDLFQMLSTSGLHTHIKTQHLQFSTFQSTLHLIYLMGLYNRQDE